MEQQTLLGYALGASHTLGLMLALMVTSAAQNNLQYPRATRLTETETMHGISVSDPYRWMEDTESVGAKEWVKAEDQLLKSWTEGGTSRAEIERRLRGLVEYDQYASPGVLNHPVAKRSQRYFFAKTSAGESVAVLVMREHGRDRVVLDPRTRYEKQALLLVAFVPSPNGRLVACGLAQDQQSWFSYHIIDVHSGAELGVVKNANRADPTVAWTQDSKGFFYTAFKREETEHGNAIVQDPRILYHRVARPEGPDTVVFYRPDKPAWLYTYRVTDDGGFLVLEAREGSARAASVFLEDLRGRDPRIRPLIENADADYTFLGNIGQRFWFYTDGKAPRGRVVALDVSHPDRKSWKEVVPQSNDAISGHSSVGGNAVGMFGQRIVLMYLKDGKPAVKIFSARGKLEHVVTLPTGGTIWGGFSGSQGILKCSISTWVSPTQVRSIAWMFVPVSRLC